LKLVRKSDGETLGRYQIIKHLASGGMAQVLLAKATGIEGFERYVVIKRIHVERAHDQMIVKMFLDEARLAAALHHQHIVQVHDIGQEKGEYFFAMEYVHGEDLRAVLTKLSREGATSPLEHVITIVAAAASALHYAHEFRGPDRRPLNIVHRDVSPANILVGYDGQVKVVDFGIAKATVRSSETQSGTLKGKISYMAPEQCMNQAIDRRSDVFALGIVLWELCCVRRLFKCSSEYLTMTAIVQGDIPKPSIHRPDLPPELESIIMKALAPKPADRYQTAEELRAALDAFADARGLRTSTTALAAYMVAKFGRRPEPWLVDDDADGERKVADVDFDGAPEPQSSPTRTPPGLSAPPGSLLARAKRKIAPASGVQVTAMPPAPAPSAPPSSGWGVTDESVTTASGTPMAWAGPASVVEPSISRAKGRRWIVVAVTASALVIGVLVVATTSGSRSSSDPPGSTPASDRAPAAAPSEPVAEPARLAEPAKPAESATPAEPAKPAAPAPPAPTPIATPAIPKPADKTARPTAAATTVAKKKPVKATPTPPTTPTEKWNPDKLFLRKNK
jgi:serine/threonine-protein kinase